MHSVPNCRNLLAYGINVIWCASTVHNLGELKKISIQDPFALKCWQGDIHLSILALGRKYTSGEVTGATARAVAMLMAFKQVVMDYYTPPDKVCTHA